MEAKVGTLDVVETRQSSVPSNSPKISKFGSKAGFVIPKNKLSGSLVPIFRGSPKPAPADVIREEDNQLSSRKTKWGVDPTQDASVRKGRILAYQTRLEQITQLLEAGALGIGDGHDLQSPLQLSSDGDSKISGEELAQLELEKREVIGEILRLNPNYKSPSDYKPLLKEDKVPIPIKAYPEYNFIVLLLGPESNALKRLEEETGVKVHVLGTKAGTGEKKEILQSELNEPQSTYEDLYVHVSAESFEKVDAAIALIELLLTPVIANHAATATSLKSGDGGNVPDSTQKTSTSAFETMPLSTGSQVAVPQATVPAQPVPLQYQPYSAPWYPIVPTSVPMPPSSGAFRLPPPHSSPIRFPVPSSNVAIRPQPFGVRTPFLPSPRNSSGMAAAQAQQPPMNVLQRPMVPQQLNVIASAPQPPMHQPTPNRPLSFPPTTSTPTGGMPAPRASLPPQASHMGPTFPTAPIPSRPLVSPMPPGNSGWSNAPSLVTPSMRPSNMQMPPFQIPPQRPPTVAPRTPHLVQNLPPHSAGIPMGASQAIPSFPSHSSVPTPSEPTPIALAYTPSPVSGPSPVSAFSTGPHAPVSGSTSTLAHSTQQVSPHPLIRGPFSSGQAANPLPSPIPAAQLQMSTPGSVSGSLTVAPQVTALKPPRPSSGDFTFQPAGSPVAASTSSSRLPNMQPSAAFLPGLQGTPQPPTPNAPQAVAPPQSPSFRPAVQNSTIPRAAVAASLPQQAPTTPQQAPTILPAPAASPANVPVNNANIVQPLQRPIFPSSQNASPTAPFNPRGPMMFPPPPSQSMGSVPPVPLIPNQFPHPTQPRPLNIPTQQLSTGSVIGCSAPSPGGNQIYDPFSPSSIPSGAQLNSDTRPNAGKSENDVEYEDLMASMGVR